jgi:hypothetical protein
MSQRASIKLFEDKNIRTLWDEQQEKWYFSIVGIVGVLTEQSTRYGARNYWKVLKHRLSKENLQLVTNCNRLKLVGADGKMRETDVADPEQILRIIQSIPSPKAEPFKLWLARRGATVAGNARREIESRTGRPAISGRNAKQLKRIEVNK